MSGDFPPHVCVTDDDLDRFAKAGDEFTCLFCSERHVLTSSSSEDGEVTLLFYRCGEDLYMAGINGRLFKKDPNLSQ